MSDRLLLLHDGPLHDLTLDDLVSQGGYRSLPVEGLGEAVHALGEDGYSCMLLDIGSAATSELPRFLSLVQQIPEVSRPYVIAILSEGEERQIALALLAGADEAIVWPRSKELLLAHLRPARRFLALQRAFRSSAMKDSLTGVMTRVGVLDRLDTEIERARRFNTPLVVGMADLDSFKRINDTLGHQAGDCVLMAAASRIRGQLRPYDAVGRLGGDEFLLVLSGCNLVQAQDIANRVRMAVHDDMIEVGDQPLTVSLCIGLSLYEPGSCTCRDDLIRAADRALLYAKQTGKNRVIAAGLPQKA